MTRRLTIVLPLLIGLFSLALPGPAPAGTFTMLNAGDAHPSWSVPRINNLGNVALIRATTSAYSGSVWLWTGDWSSLQAFTGAAMGNFIFHPRLEFNDQDLIAFATGGDAVRVANLAGVITLGAAPTSLNYIIDINNNNRIAPFSWAGTNQNRIYTSDAPYSSYETAAGPGNLSILTVSLNDAGQVAYRPNGASANIYRYTPGEGTSAVGLSDYAPWDMDNSGQVIYLRDHDKVMLNSMVLRQSTAVWQSADQYSQVRISDNGQHVVWTEHNGTLWDLWTLVDGMPVNLTNAGYQQVLSPDVNNSGTIVFASATNMWVSPYRSDIWMYQSTDPRPVVYNGHFNGQNWFGWETVIGGAGTATFVADGSGGYAGRLTAGSPVTIRQTVEPPGASDLAFDFNFPAAHGESLSVAVDGTPILVLRPSDDTQPGFTHIQVPLTGAMIMSGVAGRVLTFTLDGPAGSIVELDNITVTESVSGAPDQPRAGIAGRLAPNPTAGGTTLYFTLPEAGRVDAIVCDLQGRTRAVLPAGWRNAGEQQLAWDGCGSDCERLAPGVYFLRVTAGSRTWSWKMVRVD